MSAIVNKVIKKAYSGPLVILRSGYGHLRVIWGPVWEVSSEGHLGSILRSFWDPF